MFDSAKLQEWKEKGVQYGQVVKDNRNLIAVVASALFSFLAWRGVKKLGGNK